MKIKSLQLNTIFDYVKDIRRYSYNIEEALNSYSRSKVNVQQSPPLPDEVEPEIPRFVCNMKLNELLITVNISQVRITIIVDFSNKIEENDSVKISTFNDISSNIKAILSKEVKNFTILYEGMIATSEHIVKDLAKTVLFEHNDKLFEQREKISIETSRDYMMTTEKIFVKGYNAESAISALNRNNDKNFAGYIELIIKEINNRKVFNYGKNKKNNILIIDDIKEEFLKGK